MILLRRGGINRIRLEFKGTHVTTFRVVVNGLIESDWNLKETGGEAILPLKPGLIESDWNLKVFIDRMGNLLSFGLIESDWNLKVNRSTAY